MRPRWVLCAVVTLVGTSLLLASVEVMSGSHCSVLLESLEPLRLYYDSFLCALYLTRLLPCPTQGLCAGENASMPPPKTTVTAFAGAARSLVPRIRNVLASTCRAAPSLARALVERSRMPKSIGPLRGGADIAPGVGSTFLRAAGTVAAPAGTSNPLLAAGDFPLYSEVTAEHVLPGMKALIEDAEAALSSLEARLTKDDYEINCADFLAELERMSDRIGRAWGVVNHLKAVKDTEALRNAVEAVQPVCSRGLFVQICTGPFLIR